MLGLSEKITSIIGGAMAFVMIGLAVALFVTRGTLEKRTAERDAAFAQVQAEQAEHAVTRQSLDQALAEIARLNAEADARAKAYTEAKQRNAATQARLDALAKEEGERQAMLDGIRQHEEATGTCPVNPGLIEAAEGL